MSADYRLQHTTLEDVGLGDDEETVLMMMAAGGGGLGVEAFLTMTVTPLLLVSKLRSERCGCSAFHPFSVRVPAVSNDFLLVQYKNQQVTDRGEGRLAHLPQTLKVAVFQPEHSQRLARLVCQEINLEKFL